MPEPETVVTEAPATPEIKVIEVQNTVVDTSGYDEALTVLEEMRERVDVEELPKIEERIAKIKEQRTKVESSADAQELASYRAEKFNKEIAAVLSGTPIKIEDVPGSTPQERLVNAQMFAKALAPALAAPDNPSEPTPEQIAAHGAPITPGGDIPIEATVLSDLDKAVVDGRPKDVLSNPAFRESIGLAPIGK